MKASVERLSDDSFALPWVRLSHEERYKFASLFVKNQAVVDCACGSGRSSKMFADAPAKNVLAYDYNERTLSQASSRYYASNLFYQCCSAYSLPLRESSVDVFISLETIEHLEEDRRFLSEVTRVLKPDSLFICSTPNRSVSNPGISLQGKPDNPFHVREYTADEFRALLSRYFQSIQLYGQRRVHPAIVKISTWLSLSFGNMVGVRFYRISKLLGFITRNSKKYQVESWRDNCYYTNSIACCREPIQTGRVSQRI